MIAIVRSERQFTRADRLRIRESPGRPARRVAGGWISDLVSLRKALTLCDACRRKFDAGRCAYTHVWHAGMSYVTANCDGCREPLVRCQLFQPSEQSPHEGKRLSRRR